MQNHEIMIDFNHRRLCFNISIYNSHSLKPKTIVYSLKHSNNFSSHVFHICVSFRFEYAPHESCSPEPKVNNEKHICTQQKWMSRSCHTSHHLHYLRSLPRQRIVHQFHKTHSPYGTKCVDVAYTHTEYFECKTLLTCENLKSSNIFFVNFENITKTTLTTLWFCSAGNTLLSGIQTWSERVNNYNYQTELQPS